jgi:hypothetical protein
MSIVTVGDGLGWSCEAMIQLGHAVHKVAGRGDKTLGKLERIARSLAQCRERRPEYNTILLAKPFLAPERFPSLQDHRKAVGEVLNRIVTAVEREMRSAHVDSSLSQSRGRSRDESFAWGLEESPFIASINDAINQLEQIEISSDLEAAFARASR